MSKWNIEEMTGYQPQTTLWEDMEIADMFGLDAIQDTYNRVFNEWHNDYKVITEFCMVLNHRCWLHYGLYDKFKNDKNKHMSMLYSNLYYKLDEWCLDHLKNAELEYYIKTTD